MCNGQISLHVAIAHPLEMTGANMHHHLGTEVILGLFRRDPRVERACAGQPDNGSGNKGLLGKAAAAQTQTKRGGRPGAS